MEKLLHYVWKHRLLPLKALNTTDGEPLEVVDAGLANPHAGPDFFNAKVRIGGTLWAGNVEIHLRASDWQRHGHDTDEVYESVVLHVAHVIDSLVHTASGKRLPQLQLDLPAGLADRYAQLSRTEDYPRCHAVLPGVEPFKVHAWMDTLLCERMEERAAQVMRRLQDSAGNWERVLFLTLARNFGFGLNGDAFEAWARRIPLERIGKHRDDLFQIEALFLGQAGLLEKAQSIGDYAHRLAREHTYQQRLFGLPEPMSSAQWKYLRLRPQSFPHIRLAQLAQLYHRGGTGLAALREAAMSETPVERLHALLATEASPAWSAGPPLEGKRPAGLALSRTTRQLLMINTVVPVLFAHATAQRNEAQRERAIDLLRLLPAEDNRILRQWRDCGVAVDTAADSQALIQLKHAYCDRADCLRCRLGYEYLKAKA